MPVLLLSARAGQEAAVEGLAARADDYLVKPFSAPRSCSPASGAHLQLGRVAPRGRGPVHRDGRPRAGDDLGGRPRRRPHLPQRGLAQFTGATPAEDLGRAGGTGLHPDDRERYRDGHRGGHGGGPRLGGRVPAAPRRRRLPPGARAGRRLGPARTASGGSAAASTSTPGPSRPSASGCSPGRRGARRGRPRSTTSSAAWRGCSSRSGSPTLCVVLRRDDDGRLHRPGSPASTRTSRRPGRSGPGVADGPRRS